MSTPHEAEARRRKADRLVGVAVQAGATADMVAEDAPGVRDTLVAAANVNPPSDETWAQVVERLQRVEARDASSADSAAPPLAEVDTSGAHLILAIDLDNAAFHPEMDDDEDGPIDPLEIHRLLNVAAGRILLGHTDGVLVDINGNTVGQWKIVEP